MKTISICIPCYNEEANIRRAYERVTAIMQDLPAYEYEILFEDNASTDGSEAVFRALVAADAHVRVILNRRNFGPGRSGTNCLVRSRGDAAVLLACDLQDPPELIPRMLELWEQGAQVVWGQKEESAESGLMFRVRVLYYHILIDVVGVPMYPQVDGFGLYDRAVLDDGARFCDTSRGMKALVGDAGYDVALLPYRQDRRCAGKSSYNIGRYFAMALHMVVTNSTRPLEFMFFLGSGLFGLGLVALVAYLIVSLATGRAITVGELGIMLLLVLAALQLVFTAAVGVYVARLGEQIDNRPFVFEREVIEHKEEDSCGNHHQ